MSRWSPLASGLIVILLLVIGPLPGVACGLDVLVEDVNMIQISEQQIVHWVFGNIGSESQARKALDDQAELRIDAIQQGVELNPGQLATLQLAAEGDKQRFFAEYQLLRAEIPLGSIPQAKWQQVWQKVQPLRQRYEAGILGRSSLLAKTVKSVLSEEQWAAYQSLEQERLRRNYLALVKATIASIESKCPLTIDQREQLTTLIMDRSKSMEFTGQRYYQMYFVLAQMSQIPEEEIKPIFQEKEWGVINRARQQGVQMLGILDRQVPQEDAD